MYRNNTKDTVAMSIKLRRELSEKLENYKQKTGAPKIFVIEKALEEYLKRHADSNN